MIRVKILQILPLLFIFLTAQGRNCGPKQFSDSVETLTAKWTFSTGGRIYSTACYQNGLVYFGSEDKKVYALERESGKQRWAFSTSGAIYASPVINNGRLYVLSMDGCLYALDAQHGQLLWKFRTGGEQRLDMWDYYLSDPVVKDDIVYFGSSDHHVYAINANNGQLKWKFKTGGMVHAAPVVQQDSLFIGSFDGWLYALHAKTGKLFWKFHTVGDAYFPNGELQRAALYDQHTLYAGSRDYNIYAIDPASGRGKWNMKEKGSWIIATPLALNNRLYFGTSDSHTFYCMDAAYGKVKWTLPLNMRVYGSAVADSNLVYFGCFNGKIYGVDAERGTITKTFQTAASKQHYASVFGEDDHFRKDFELYGQDATGAEQKILSLGSFLATPLLQDGVLYMGSADGNFYAIPVRPPSLP